MINLCFFNIIIDLVINFWLCICYIFNFTITSTGPSCRYDKLHGNNMNAKQTAVNVESVIHYVHKHGYSFIITPRPLL